MSEANDIPKAKSKPNLNAFDENKNKNQNEKKNDQEKINKINNISNISNISKKNSDDSLNNSSEVDKENVDTFEKYALYNINNRKLFDNNPNYDLSSRLINDEIINIPNPVIIGDQKEIKSFEVLKLKSIKTVSNKNNLNNIDNEKKQFLNFTKFLSLDDDIILNILGFSFPFFSEIVKSTRHIARRFHLALNNKYANLIYLCRESFKEHLELEEFIFKPSFYKRHRVVKPSN